MDRTFNLTVDLGFVILPILGVLGAALIVGGFIIYRGNKNVGARAFGGAAIAAGVVPWAFVLYITPISGTRGGEQVAPTPIESQVGALGTQPPATMLETIVG